MKPLLIGLSGKAGSGKTTVADYLREHYQYHQFAFATALKDVVGTAFAMTEDHLHGPLKEEIDPRWGYSPRYLMQWLGTEVLRARWPEIWIRHLRQDILDFLGTNGQKPIVVADVRFRDEAEALKRMGARLWRLERPGHPGAYNGIEGHVSEMELDDYRGWDAVVIAPTKEQLWAQVDYLVNPEPSMQRDPDQDPFYPDVPIREDSS